MDLITVKQARKRISKALQEEHTRQGYIDNIACIIMENIPGYKRDKPKRDQIADKILQRIFEG